MSESPVLFTSSTHLSGLHLEKTPNGHVVTPWFQFDWHAEGLTGVADSRSCYHQIVNAAADAFAGLLGIRRLDVIVTQQQVPSDHVGYWWRLGTRRPCDLPKPKVMEKPVLPENQGAIDI